MATTGDLSLYFHIPFCKKKCPYCAYYSVYPNKYLVDSFIDAIIKEMDLYPLKNITSIFFGGGTPSSLDIKHIEKILKKIDIDKNCEITLEANPEDITLSKIIDLRSIGINRMSFGVQSFDDNLLKRLGRSHDSKKALEGVYIASKAFDNISADIMYDIPGMDFSSFKNTIELANSLPITHLSIYNLFFEKNTPFYKIKDQLKKDIPREEKSAEMITNIREYLYKKGFIHYEISSYAKKEKYISKHNLGYWIGREFLGFGPSGFSYFENSRFQNIKNVKKYIELINKKQSTIAFRESLSYPKNILELLVLNLRVLKGVDITKIKLPQKTKLLLKTLIEDGLLEKIENRIALTKKGILFYDYVASTLI